MLTCASSYLGHKPIWNWLTANTALPNTKGMRQAVHKDNTFPHPRYPFYFIANVPLCEFCVENGATEFWLGSHAHTSSRDQVMATKPEDVHYAGYHMGQPLPAITDEALEARHVVRPPVQPKSSPGDVVIRDIRLWHAGKRPLTLVILDSFSYNNVHYIKVCQMRWKRIASCLVWDTR